MSFSQETLYDVIIIGSGPAGLTAAIYATRANLKTLVLAGSRWGGQLMLTTEVENFPGFPEGIMGPDLMMNMRKQAEHHGTEIVEADFIKGDFNKQPFEVVTADKTYQSKSIIIATGADTKWLDVPGEKDKIGRGVSSCAPCDAAFFRGKNVIVVGGGDSAMEEANFLTKFADKVTIVHRRGEFRASAVMLDRAKENPKIDFVLYTAVTEILGDQKVEKVKLKNLKTGEEKNMPIDGVFVAIGQIPNSAAFSNINKDEKGYIVVENHFQTNIPGVFVAGDVHDHDFRQGITAAGFGAAAALTAERWLQVS